MSLRPVHEHDCPDDRCPAVHNCKCCDAKATKTVTDHGVLEGRFCDEHWDIVNGVLASVSKMVARGTPRHIAAQWGRPEPVKQKAATNEKD